MRFSLDRPNGPLYKHLTGAMPHRTRENEMTHYAISGDQPTEQAIDLAKALWAEQLALGYGEPEETVTDEGLVDWFGNQMFDGDDLNDAAAGDAAALATIRQSCGLPLFS